jgi:hypothetical protein
VESPGGNDEQPPLALTRASPLYQTSARHFGALKRSLATRDLTRSIFRRILATVFPDRIWHRDRGYRTSCRNRVDILKYIITLRRFAARTLL